jgi:hypothetical protein
MSPGSLIFYRSWKLLAMWISWVNLSSGIPAGDAAVLAKGTAAKIAKTTIFAKGTAAKLARTIGGAVGGVLHKPTFEEQFPYDTPFIPIEGLQPPSGATGDMLGSAVGASVSGIFSDVQRVQRSVQDQGLAKLIEEHHAKGLTLIQVSVSFVGLKMYQVYENCYIDLKRSTSSSSLY